MNRLISIACMFGLVGAIAGCKDQADRDSERTVDHTETAESSYPESSSDERETQDEMAEDEMAEDEMAEDEMAEDEMAEDEMAEDEMAEDEMAGDGTTIATQSSDIYGDYLADGDGMTLYVFEGDKKDKPSTCNDACAEAWPPVVVGGEAMMSATGSADGAKLGAVDRRDGTLQATYWGWPLYYFASDEAPGDTQGQDKTGFGGQWYLMAPSGDKVESDSQAAKTR